MARNSLLKQIVDADISEVEDDRLLTPLIIKYRLDQGRYSAYTDKEGIDIAVKMLEEQNSRIDGRKGRKSYSGGSSVNCMRKQMIDILSSDSDTPPPDPEYRLSLIFEDGNWRNLKWLVEFHRMGILKEYEKTSYNSKINLSWTPDARVDLSAYYGEEYSDVPVEIKGANDWEFQEFRKRSGRGRQAASRIMQIHAYMLAENVDHWLVFMENKNTQDIEEYWCKRDPNIIKLLRRKYKYMEEARRLKVLPAIECGMVETDSMYMRCPRNKECSKLVMQSYPTLAPMKNKATLEEKARKGFV